MTLGAGGSEKDPKAPCLFQQVRRQNCNFAFRQTWIFRVGRNIGFIDLGLGDGISMLPHGSQNLLAKPMLYFPALVDLSFSSWGAGWH